MKLSPQSQTVLAHLVKAGSISGVEAAAVHRVRHLPRRIADLRDAGYQITPERKKDAVGQAYVRYHLTQVEPVEVAAKPTREIAQGVQVAVKTTPGVEVDRALTTVPNAHTRYIDASDGYENIDTTFDSVTQTLHIQQDDDIIGMTKLQLRDFIAGLTALEKLFA